MENYEKLGVFYLGRVYDLKAKSTTGELLLYDAKDLVTHAMIVGMTGSGKTGLGIGLIEEAALDGLPVIAIDPKGDLGNLLLTFPALQPADFLPWINQEEARKKGLTPEVYAGQQAELWRKGLAEWGQSGERIQRLREAAEFVLYTPGSTAGLPVSILKSFAAPGAALMEDSDLWRERISTTVTSLLSLVGIQADPIQSREHILLSTLLDLAWRQGQDMDLARLIQQVQTPPISKVGVLDLESFYPAKERFGLVMALNNVLASPGFGTWLEGEPLDIGQILYTPTGKPRVAIFSIAHLSDAERMFFVALLLNQILGWMRTQPGTTSLRALVYMDEIFGYFPPLGNPPAKLPLLTLLKQARAFGVGIVLATQNPVDLDYKGLANTGTWFVGRLQTERDKARLLDGLEGVAATAGTGFNRQELDRTLSALSSRVFLLNNVHDREPAIFQTRWAMSYLAGPLTREQIRILMAPFKAAKPAPAAAPQPVAAAPVAFATAAPTAAPSPAPSAPAAAVTAPTGQPPALPPGISQFFIPLRGRVPARLVYQPRVLGAAQVRLSDLKAKVDMLQDVLLLAPISDAPLPVDWAEAQEATFSLKDLGTEPQGTAIFTALPTAATQARNYATWSRNLATWLYQNHKLELFRSPSLGEVSRPGETERDFRLRVQQSAREQRDAALDKLRQKYAPKLAALQERIRRAQQVVEKQAEQAKMQKAQAAISMGATLLTALTGRKLASQSTVGRATTAVRGVTRAMGEQQDVARAKETVEALQQQLAALEAEFEAQAAALQSRIDIMTETLETISIRPKKTDITVQLVALVWAPYGQDAQGILTPAWA